VLGLGLESLRRRQLIIALGELLGELGDLLLCGSSQVILEFEFRLKTFELTVAFGQLPRQSIRIRFSIAALLRLAFVEEPNTIHDLNSPILHGGLFLQQFIAFLPVVHTIFKAH